jgi:hypothetical protein
VCGIEYVDIRDGLAGGSEYARLDLGEEYDVRKVDQCIGRCREIWQMMCVPYCLGFGV